MCMGVCVCVRACACVSVWESTCGFNAYIFCLISAAYVRQDYTSLYVYKLNTFMWTFYLVYFIVHSIHVDLFFIILFML